VKVREVQHLRITL